MPPSACRLLTFVRLTHGEASRVTIENAERRREGRDAETRALRLTRKMRGAGHQEQVARQLHQRLREELVQLVGVVVDSRDQVAGLVLIEEVERQLLQLGEQGVAQLEQHAAADRAHRQRLDVGGDQPDDVDREQDGREAQHAARSRRLRM